MRFKIELRLNQNDFRRIHDILDNNPNSSLELLPYEDFEFATISPLSVIVKDHRYSINGMVSFQQPIGLKVYDALDLDKDLSKFLLINYRNIKLSKIVTEADELEENLKISLNLLERIFNLAANMNNKYIEKKLIVNSDGLDKQLDLIVRARELDKRGEVARAFGTIHAKDKKDAGERGGSNLVPIYWEKDKTYLYDDKKIYMLLPRDFVMKLLKLNHSTLVPTTQFTDQELNILQKFTIRKYVKTMKVAGKIFYHDLNEKTRQHLLKGMKKI